MEIKGQRPLYCGSCPLFLLVGQFSKKPGQTGCPGFSSQYMEILYAIQYSEFLPLSAAVAAITGRTEPPNLLPGFISGIISWSDYQRSNAISK